MQSEQAMDPEDRRAILQAHWENFRYQDELRWSRTKTLALIEGAMLAALSEGARWMQEAPFVVAGTLLVFLMSLLALKDATDADYHAGQAIDMQVELGHPRRVFAGFVERNLKGGVLFAAALLLLNAFNVYLIFWRPWA